jgi:hypothetical protein
MDAVEKADEERKREQGGYGTLAHGNLQPTTVNE